MAGVRHSEYQCSDTTECGLMQFIIAYVTCGFAQVLISKWLSDRAPDEMTSCELEEAKEDSEGLGLRPGGKMGNVFTLAEVGELLLE